MHHATIYGSAIAAVFSLNDQGLKTYSEKLKKANMLVPLKNTYAYIYKFSEKWRPQEQPQFISNNGQQQMPVKGIK